jgi:spermidine synthase
MMSRISNNRSDFTAIHVVVFLAGFSFLLYEVSWNRLLSLVLGTTVTASTIVLAAFMAGFGAGAYFWGRVASKGACLGRLLGVILGGIGVISLADYYLIQLCLPNLYVFASQSNISPGLCDGLIYFLTALLLFVPAFLIGGVFPIASQIAVSLEKSITTCLGRLYAVETLGSTVGGLITGFVLLGFLGQRQTIFVGVGINIILAAWLVLLGKFNYIQATDVSSDGLAGNNQAKNIQKPKRSTFSPSYKKEALRKAALVATLVCGFSVLSLQVFWIRIFRIYMTNTSYSFALISSLAILGLFAGAILFQRKGGVRGDPIALLFKVLAIFGLLTGAGLVVSIYLPQILMFPFQSIFADPKARVFLLPVLASALIVFPPAVCSGFAFPLACRMYADGRERLSRDVGFVLMLNTAGSVFGPIIATFVLLPLLGVSLSVVFVLLVISGALIFLSRQMAPGGRGKLSVSVVYVVLVMLVGLLAFRPAIRILPPSFSRYDWPVLYYRESVEGTLSVGRDNAGMDGTKYTYVNNSAVIGSTYDSIKVVKMVGHTPFFLGLECRNVLVIGFGIGVTTSAIAAHEEVESIECVELMSGIEEAAVYYRNYNRGVASDPRLTIRQGDGRHFLQRTTNRYDLISCDPTHPILGSGSLYTEDYFSLCKAHLNPGGMVSQYLPLHKMRPEDFQGIVSTFHSVFPNSTVWLGHYHAVLLGSLDPIQIDFETWTANIDKIGKDIHFYSDPYHLAANLMLDGDAIAELATGDRINTDDKSYTEFFDPACLDPGNISNNLSFFMENRIELTRVFSNISDQEKMSRFLQGNQLLTESIFFQKNGDFQKGLAALQQACRVNPESEELPFLIRLEY